MNQVGHGLNIRPQGQPNAAAYNPNRDLANCVPSLIKMAIWGLQQENWEPWMRALTEVHGTTNEQLAYALTTYVRALNAMRQDPLIDSPLLAIQRSGFHDADPVAATLVLAKMQQIITGAFFVAIKDTTRWGDSARRDIDELVLEADRVAHQLRRA